MSSLRLLIALSFFCSFLAAINSQNCDREQQASEIRNFLRIGDFEGAKEWLEDHSNCTFDSTSFDQWLLDFEISRNRRKGRSALAAAERAASLTDESALLDNKIEVCLALAEAYSMRRQVAAGRQQLQQAQVLLTERASSSLLEGRISYIEGILLRHDPTQAEAGRAAFRAAIQQLTQSKGEEIFILGLMLRTLGNSARNAGDFPLSAGYYQQELALYQANYPANHNEIAFAYYHLGAVYYEMQDYQVALDHFLLSFHIWKEYPTADNRYWRYLCEAIGDMYWELADRTNALYYYDLAAEVTSLASLDSSSNLTLQADTLLTNGQTQEALFFYQQALDFRMANYGAQHPLTASCRAYVAKAKAANHDTLAALADYQSVIQSSTVDFDSSDPHDNPPADAAVINLNTLLEAMSGKGSLLLELALEQDDQTTLEAAANCLQRSIDFLELLRRKPLSDPAKLFWNQRSTQLIEAAIRADIELYELYTDEAYLERAFLTNEKGNSFLLLSAMRTEAAIAFAGVPRSITDDEHELRNAILTYEQKVLAEENRCQSAREKQLDLWREKLSSLRLEYEQLLFQIEQDYPSYFALKFAPAPHLLSDWQSVLGQEQMALISYFQGEEQLYLFLLTEATIQLIEVDDLSSFPQDIQLYMSLISEPETLIRNSRSSYRSFSQIGFRLYEQLLAKALAACPNDIDRLIIIPSAELASLPFSLLLQTAVAEEVADFRKLPYLLINYAISYASSATVWLEANRTIKSRTGSSYRGFAANTDYDTTLQLSALQYAEEEIIQGQSIFGGQTFVGPTATERVFRQSNADILHLATHTLIDDELPLQSSLLLAPDDTHDGRLQAFELYELSLNNQLAILSACATATGEWVQSEGQVGLERAFQYAGTAALLTTFWAVDDQASAVLVQYFLEELQAGQPKDQALRQAKLRYLQIADPATAIPYLWGAYRLSGDPRPFQPKSWWSSKWWIAFLLLPVGLFLGWRKFYSLRATNNSAAASH
ncbi:MAG: CHAT domain-containing tetratricopeptide repeat protein [Bacteroidota bacterium]